MKSTIKQIKIGTSSREKEILNLYKHFYQNNPPFYKNQVNEIIVKNNTTTLNEIKFDPIIKNNYLQLILNNGIV